MKFQHQPTLPTNRSIRSITAVLGPTNTGKTHLAIERMLAHKSGMIGLPLRLLAREVYHRVVQHAGQDAVAFITGEEKIKPENPRYWVCTVEAMPLNLDVDFVAIDEIQLASDFERGHVFTNHLLNMRGAQETLLLGAATMRPIIDNLLPGVHIASRPRLSKLTYTGSKKLTRMPGRSAIVTFSSDEVYAIAEFIRRQRGGAAVVLGSLSPRTRNAQVALYQSGDVDFLVATDAIGMGLNLDVDHVAFAADQKFDGFTFRNLNPAEMGQIAGRAGRHLKDGTFGATSHVQAFSNDLIQMLENHQFAPIKTLQWRNDDLDFSTLHALRQSLDIPPQHPSLARALPQDDIIALEAAIRDEQTARLASNISSNRLLWDVCQIPDYRKIAPAQHADLLQTIFAYLIKNGRLPHDWFAKQVGYADRTDGDIDTLATRIAHIRTWTFIANRHTWLDDTDYWQNHTREVEDRLSDALHERLIQRFVDRRTAVLMRRLRENDMLEAEINSTGNVLVDGHLVGHLHGFRFTPDYSAEAAEAKVLRNAAQKVLANEITLRAERFANAADSEFVLASDGLIRWKGEIIARMASSDDILKPKLLVLADEHLNGHALTQVNERLQLWLDTYIMTCLKPLINLRGASDLEGTARGLAFRLIENLGILDRQDVADEIRRLDQAQRGPLRQYGVRFGAYNIYLPMLLKPAPAGLLAILWALHNGGTQQPGLTELSNLSVSGRTSILIDPEIATDLYQTAGFRVCGKRVVRIDILERLADIIRPLITFKKGLSEGEPPEGAAEGNGFTVTIAMTSLAGCAGEDFAAILRSLGYQSEKREQQAAETKISDETPSQHSDSGPSHIEGTLPETIDSQDNADHPLQHENKISLDEGHSHIDHAETIAETVVGDDAGIDEHKSDEASHSMDQADHHHADVELTAAESEEITPDEGALTTAEEQSEPDIIEIWRPARNERPRKTPYTHATRDKNRKKPRLPDDNKTQHSTNHQQPQDRKINKRSRNAPHHKGDKKPQFKHAHDRRKKSEKMPDPDSPFAALLALKKTMEKQNKDDT